MKMFLVKNTLTSFEGCGSLIDVIVQYQHHISYTEADDISDLAVGQEVTAVAGTLIIRRTN